MSRVSRSSSAVDEAQAMTTRIGKGLILQFNIGFVASTLYDTLRDLMRRFRVLVPGVEVNLLEMTTLEQVAALKDGRIDVGFGRLSFNDDMITRRVLREERLLARRAPRPRSRRAGGGSEARRHGPETLVVYPKYRAPLYADQVLGFYGARTFSPSRSSRPASSRRRSAWWRRGGGVCVVPASARRSGAATLPSSNSTSPG